MQILINRFSKKESKMAVNWSMTSANGESSIVIFLQSGETLTVTDNHPNFDKIRNYVIDMDDDFSAEKASDDLTVLANLIHALDQKLTRLSERITTDGTNIFFDGDQIDSSVAKYLMKALRADGAVPSLDTENPDTNDDDNKSNVSWQAIVAFLEKLYQNSSKESIEHLYSFVQRYDLTIRPNGDFIAFKGLRDDYGSVYAGPGIVDGVNYSHASLPNLPGSVVEVSRSYVDTNPEEGCSTGLHAGTFEFAKQFSQGKLVAVAVNPRDVVSVPSDREYQKIRACRYEVLNDIPGDYTRDNSVFLWEDDEDVCEDCDDHECENYECDDDPGEDVCEDCDDCDCENYECDDDLDEDVCEDCKEDRDYCRRLYT